MNTLQTLYKLLYLAMVELRYRAIQNDDKGSYALAHMLHRLPLRLGNLSKEEISVEEMMEELKTISVEVGADGWLTAQLKTIGQHIDSSP